MFTDTEESEFELERRTSFPATPVSTMPSSRVFPSVSRSLSSAGIKSVISSAPLSSSPLHMSSMSPTNPKNPRHGARNATVHHMNQMTATCAEADIEPQSFQGDLYKNSVLLITISDL